MGASEGGTPARKSGSSSKPKYERVTDDPEVQAAIRRVVDEAPPLTSERIARLRVLFNADAGPMAGKPEEG